MSDIAWVIIGCTILIIVCLGGARRLIHVVMAVITGGLVVMLIMFVTNKWPSSPTTSVEFTKEQRDQRADEEHRAWVKQNQSRKP